MRRQLRADRDEVRSCARLAGHAGRHDDRRSPPSGRRTDRRLGGGWPAELPTAWHGPPWPSAPATTAPRSPPWPPAVPPEAIPAEGGGERRPTSSFRRRSRPGTLVTVPASAFTASGWTRAGRADAENTRPRLRPCSAQRVRSQRMHRPRSRRIFGPPLRQLASGPSVPVEGGSANDYDYARGDPLQLCDLSGRSTGNCGDLLKLGLAVCASVYATCAGRYDKPGTRNIGKLVCAVRFAQCMSPYISAYIACRQGGHDNPPSQPNEGDNGDPGTPESPLRPPAINRPTPVFPIYPQPVPFPIPVRWP